MLKEILLILNETYSEESVFHGITLEKSTSNKLIEENDHEMKSKNLQIIFANKINGKILSISFNQNSTIFNMKNEVQRKTFLKFNEFYLEFHGEHLNNDKTMNYYQIVDKSIINIIGALKGGKKIRIQTVNEKSFDIEISDDENVLNLKSKIKTETNISENEQELYIENVKLENSQKIRTLQIKEGSFVRCLYKEFNLTIMVNILGKYNTLLDVNKNTKIIEVKKMIKEKINMKIDEQKMLYGIKVLDDKKTIDSYGINNGDPLLVVAHVPGGEFPEEIMKLEFYTCDLQIVNILQLN